jgi:tetratricopeptide (TPR) repeat protein
MKPIACTVAISLVTLFVLLPAWGGEDESESLYKAALAAMQAGHHEQALETFEAAIQEAPNNLRYGNDYRQLVIKINTKATYDRCLGFFKQLVADHSNMPNAWMNYGYAYVDKIPTEGAITQVLLANTALGYFTTALDLKETWLARYTRGNSYLYWPAIFGRTPAAIADLERAIEMSRATTRQPYHARAYVGLGEAYWRLNDLKKARHIWRLALERFPGYEPLQQRLSLDDHALNDFLTAHFEPGRRVDTDVSMVVEATVSMVAKEKDR